MTRKHKVVMAVGTLLALLAVVGTPAFLRARESAITAACRGNLMRLYGPMCCCVPMAANLTAGDVMKPEQIEAYIKDQTIPKCPLGQEYEISWVVGGPPPTCPHHGHLLPYETRKGTLRDLPAYFDKSWQNHEIGAFRIQDSDKTIGISLFQKPQRKSVNIWLMWISGTETEQQKKLTLNLCGNAGFISPHVTNNAVRFDCKQQPDREALINMISHLLTDVFETTEEEPLLYSLEH